MKVFKLLTAIVLLICATTPASSEQREITISKHQTLGYSFSYLSDKSLTLCFKDSQNATQAGFLLDPETLLKTTGDSGLPKLSKATFKSNKKILKTFGKTLKMAQKKLRRKLPITRCTSRLNESVQTAPPIENSYRLRKAFPKLKFSLPLDLRRDPVDPVYLYAIEKLGRVKRFKNSRLTKKTKTFLDISSKVNATSYEEGLLGLAFHPNFQQNRQFFVYYSASNPRRTVLSRFLRSSNSKTSADPNSEEVLLEIEQPSAIHNGGALEFGPDGYLYLGVGDGGPGGDPDGNAQDKTTMLGSIIRIDVNATSSGYSVPSSNPFVGAGSGVKEEIFAYGLRNPWRFSFDLLTGNLWAGDVGQSAYEEVDLIESAANYGWNIREGNYCYPNGDEACSSAGFIAPIYTYAHPSSSSASVTGGYVYRGKRFAELREAYIFADFVNGDISALKHINGSYQHFTLIESSGASVAAFLPDSRNELLLVSLDGNIYSLQRK